jgi:hypothetical protein
MRKETFRIAFVGVALLLVTAPIRAHHSLVAEFSLNKPITLRGTLTKMEWVNPHGWIHMEVRDPEGQVEHWAVETGSPARMMKRGLKKTDFRPGIEMIVGAFAAKDGSRTAAGWIVTFVDREAAFPAREASFPLGR